MRPFTVLKRSLIGGVLLLASAAGQPVLAADARIAVLTSYPEEMTTLYEAAFEQAHPGLDVQIVWQRSQESMATLRKPDRGGIDVYWSPALFAFPTLAKDGAFRPFAVDRAAVPGRIGAQPVSDPNGLFEAFEVAGYGIVSNAAVLTARGLAPPRAWTDLARPAFAGLVTMPVAARVGFSPGMYDIILQDRGWAEGWALLSEMSANSTLSDAGSGLLPPVSAGDAAAAIGIDFLARNAIANGEPLTLTYPARTAFLPAYVAVVASTAQPEAAQAFATFVLSDEGQSLLFHPDVSRYSIRPSVYKAAPPGTANPFALGRDVTFAYDLALGPARQPLVTALFDAAIATRADKVKALWAAIHQAEAGGDTAKAEKARALAGWVPVTPAQATDAAFLRQFSNEGGDKAAAEALTASWAEQIDRRQAEALALVAGN